MKNELTQALYDIFPSEEKGDFYHAYIYLKHLEHFMYHALQAAGNPARRPESEISDEVDEMLEAAIQGHCMHMSLHPFWSHTAPESSVAKFSTRASLCGTSASAENIAQGQSSAQSVMSSWISSSGHNTNMLNGAYTRVGIGKYGAYWGQIFGR